jgi:transposase
MKPYSPDLRERVVAAAQAGELTQPAIAAKFSVSLSSVENWLRTFRQTQRTTPRPPAGGAKRVLQPHAPVIRQMVAQRPDATLEELCAHVAAQTGVLANPSMMCRELHILHLPRKKVSARQPTRNPTRPKTAEGVSQRNADHARFDRRTSKIHR